MIKQIPIIYGLTSINAMLDNSKTMTRRIIKPQLKHGVCPCAVSPTGFSQRQDNGACSCIPVKNPFGKQGDLHWVREVHYVYGSWSFSGTIGPGKTKHTFKPEPGCPILFEDNPPENIKTEYSEIGYFKRNPIYMFKKYARIWNKVKSIKAEMVQDISEEEAIKEGVGFLRHVPNADETLTNKELYMCLWDAFNKKRGFGWEKNPSVFAIGFERTEKPNNI